MVRTSTGVVDHLSDDPPCRFTFEENKITEKKLPDFDTRNTRKFFVVLGVTEEFLPEHPTTWDTNDSYMYIQAQTKAHQWNVVNNTAERGVALCQSFNGRLTNEEHQK